VQSPLGDVQRSTGRSSRLIDRWIGNGGSDPAHKALGSSGSRPQLGRGFDHPIVPVVDIAGHEVGQLDVLQQPPHRFHRVEGGCHADGAKDPSSVAFDP